MKYVDMYLREWQENSIKSYPLIFTLRIQFCQLSFHNISRIWGPWFKRVIAMIFWLFSLPPPLPHHNEFSKPTAGRSYTTLPLWPLWLSSYFTPHCHFSLLFFECDKTWFLSQDLHLPLLLPGNFFTHGSQTLCCQVSAKYDFIRKVFLKNIIKIHHLSLFPLPILFFFFELITSDNFIFVSVKCKFHEENK